MNALELLWNRVRGLVSPGRITLVRDDGSVQRMQAKLSQIDISGDLPRLAEYGFTSNPPPDSEAVVVFLAGDRSDGIVIATGSATYRLKALPEGAVALYDNLGQTLVLGPDGIVATPAAGKPFLVNGPILATGDITDNCGTNTATLQALRTAYDGHHHAVHGVSAGVATVTSDTPSPTV